MAWVIVGGESGPDARAVKSEWVESIQKQCRRAKVAFFFKQWGGTRKSVAGRGLNGRRNLARFFLIVQKNTGLLITSQIYTLDKGRRPERKSCGRPGSYL